MNKTIKIDDIRWHAQGVDVVGTEIEMLELADGTTREIQVKGYASPMGIRDFCADPLNPTEEEIELGRQKIAEHLATITGQEMGGFIAEAAIRKMERDQAQQALTQAEAAKASAEQAKQQKEQELADEKAAHQADLEKLHELEQRLEEAAKLGEVIIGLVESGEDIPEEVVNTVKDRINDNRKS